MAKRPPVYRRGSEEAPGERSPLYRGYLKATFSIRPDQLRAIRAEARRRADAAGAFRADASEVVREALDNWVRRHHGNK
jgi:hypothetical protein